MAYVRVPRPSWSKPPLAPHQRVGRQRLKVSQLRLGEAGPVRAQVEARQRMLAPTATRAMVSPSVARLDPPAIERHQVKSAELAADDGVCERLSITGESDQQIRMNDTR
jgi:hypothetical protein